MDTERRAGKDSQAASDETHGSKLNSIRKKARHVDDEEETRKSREEREPLDSDERSNDGSSSADEKIEGSRKKRKHRKKTRHVDDEKEMKKGREKEEDPDNDDKNKDGSSSVDEKSEGSRKKRKDRRKSKDKKPRKGRSATSSSDGSSESESDSEEERKKRRGRREEKEIRRTEKERERKKKENRREKKRAEREKEERRILKQKLKEKKSKGPVTQFGKYGLLKDSDMWVKRPEFSLWLQEVKKVNLEHITNSEEKILFKDFMEDYNTATMPSKKFYNLAHYEAKQAMKAQRRGIALIQPSEMTVFNDEELRRQEIMELRERRKEEEVKRLSSSMRGGMARDMIGQARLREEMQYHYRLGNFEEAAKIQKRLDPDVPT